jgi:hypothetical protein
MTQTPENKQKTVDLSNRFTVKKQRRSLGGSI